MSRNRSTPTLADTAVPDECAAAAAYIASMARDLSMIAQRHGLDTLGYLLDIVQLEAERGAAARD